MEKKTMDLKKSGEGCLEDLKIEKGEINAFI